MHPALEFSNVTRRWRSGILGTAAESIGIAGCSFSVAPGEIVIVTGGAGAGKSTLLLLAAGQAAPSDGIVRWNGANAPREARPQLIGARPWEYNLLTVRQALAFHADQLALVHTLRPAPARFVPLMASVGLRGLARVRLGQLAPIDRLRVVVAQALLAAPRLLCCEEPFAFCASEERQLAARLLRSVAGRGTAVLIATREAATIDALGLGDRALRLERGRIVNGARATHPVLELVVLAPDDAMTRLGHRLPSLARRGRRLRVPLSGRSPEAILALCRDAGVRVRGSRVSDEALPSAAAGP